MSGGSHGPSPATQPTAPRGATFLNMLCWPDGYWLPAASGAAAATLALGPLLVLPASQAIVSGTCDEYCQHGYVLGASSWISGLLEMEVFKVFVLKVF